jgi:hypothetical protein
MRLVASLVGGVLLVGGVTLYATSVGLPTATFACLNGTHNSTFGNLPGFSCAEGIGGTLDASGDGNPNVISDVKITGPGLVIPAVASSVDVVPVSDPPPGAGLAAGAGLASVLVACGGLLALARRRRQLIV